MDLAFVNYDLQSTSEESLKDEFIVKESYQNDMVYLTIDLSLINASLADSNIKGELTILNMVAQEVKYTIGFQLVCTNTEICL